MNTVVLVLQVLTPLALVIWVAVARPASRTAWAAGIVGVGAYLLAIALDGLWTAVAPHFLLAYALLFLGAITLSGRRITRTGVAHSASRRWISAAVRTAFAVAMVGLVGYSLEARQPRSEVPIVQLAFPLSGATYYVANAGSRDLINAHLMTLTEPRFRFYRGQSYGVDLLAVNDIGLRSSSPMPTDPGAYEIFGHAVLAPCAGRVLQAHDGERDLNPPEVDRSHMEGNHAVLECGEYWILLAHLRNGTVAVRRGQSLLVGDTIGLVGNSGNSDEPHLHIHAQRPGSREHPFSGDPVQIRFGERFLARNSVVRTRQVETTLADPTQ